MEKNKSIDGLRTRAEKNPDESTIDGLKSRSVLPVFGTEPHTTLKTVRKTRLSPNEVETAPKPTKKKKVVSKKAQSAPVEAQPVAKKARTTLVRTSDEDLLAAFSSDEETDSKVIENQLREVSDSFIEPANSPDDIFNEALSENDESNNEETLTPDDIVNTEDSEDSMKKSKKEKKAEKKTQKEEELKGSLLDEEEDPKKKKKAKKKPSKARKIITTIILLLVLGIIGLISWAVLWGNDIIAKITGGRGNIIDAISALVSGEKYDPLKTDSNKRTNILAFGTSGWNMEGDEGNGKHDGAQLTDSIMAISINQETGDVAMISLPRDLKASPTCTATGKVNEVYWCHNMKGDAEETGAQAIMDEVGGILGIEFQYFVHVNWASLVNIVDTLGGIKVTLDENIADYGANYSVAYDAGIEYTINGEQALGLARARHGTAMGDFSRANSQQKILIGIKDRIYEKDISLTDALSLVGTLGDNLRTNLSVSEIKTAIHLTYEFNFNNMRQLPLMDYGNGIAYMTFANINGISYVVPSAGVGNYNKIREYVRVNLNNDPVVREQARILVLNGSGKIGAAADERDLLRTEDFNVVDIDNIEGEYPDEHYIHFADKKFLGTVEVLEKKYNTVAIESFPEGYDGYDIVIVIGGINEDAEEEIVE